MWRGAAAGALAQGGGGHSLRREGKAGPLEGAGAAWPGPEAQHRLLLVGKSCLRAGPRTPNGLLWTPSPVSTAGQLALQQAGNSHA